MNDQDLQNHLFRMGEALELTLHGTKEFQNGNLEEALSAFESSFEINPQSIPNSLYCLLCRWSMIYTLDISEKANMNNPTVQAHLQDMLGKLEILKSTIELTLSRYGK